MNTLIALAAPLFNQIPHHHHDNYDDNDNHNQQQQSRSQKQMNSKGRSKKSLSLEDYLAFIHSRDFTSFTVHHIRQIMAIHGFKKGDKKRKEMEEAVAAMELINPTRSTLHEKVPPGAFITFEEAIMDLGTLNWKECSITSIRSISSPLNQAPVNPFNPVTKPATRKTKKRSASALSDFPVSRGNFKTGLKESASVSGSSSLTQKPIDVPMLTMSATSSSNNADGLALLAIAADEGNDGAGKKQFSRKRKSIKKVLLA